MFLWDVLPHFSLIAILITIWGFLIVFFHELLSWSCASTFFFLNVFKTLLKFIN